MKTIALALLLGAAPEPIHVLVQLDAAFAQSHPCPNADPEARGFCAQRARVVFTMPPRSFTGTMEVFDLETDAKLHSIRVFGGLKADPDRVYYQDTNYDTWAVDLATPKDAPKKLGRNNCGGPASPSVAAVANGIPICVTAPHNDDNQRLLIEASGVCYVPPAAWKESRGGYTLTTELLSKTCRKMLTSTRGTARP